jgi:3'-5' exoribonuclease
MKEKTDFIQLLNIKPKNLIEFSNLVLHVVTNDQFFIQSGSGYKGQHHYGNGGLAEHTYDVINRCLMNATVGCDKEVLALAALYHDIGKIDDYVEIEEDEEDEIYGDLYDTDGVKINWVPTEHKRNIHHISKSAMIFYEQSNKFGYPIDKREEVLHCILSHHMRREWGSPVSPNSKEAWLLCLCDNMSARLDDVNSWDYLKKKG